MARFRRRRRRKSPTASNIFGCCRSKPSKTRRNAAAPGSGFGFFSRPSPAEVTTFTRDLALLLKAGARLDDALELLASDADVGRLRPVVGKLRAALLTGESFAGAVADHPALFPAMYVALVRVGEVSGTLDQVLEMLGAERARAELMRRKLTDAMQYPAFVLIAAACVHAVLHPVRAAAVFFGAAGFRRKIGLRAQRFHQAVGFSSGERGRRRCLPPLRSWPASGGCFAGPARARRS